MGNGPPGAAAKAGDPAAANGAATATATGTTTTNADAATNNTTAPPPADGSAAAAAASTTASPASTAPAAATSAPVTTAPPAAASDSSSPPTTIPTTTPADTTTPAPVTTATTTTTTPAPASTPAATTTTAAPAPEAATPAPVTTTAPAAAATTATPASTPAPAATQTAVPVAVPVAAPMATASAVPIVAADEKQVAKPDTGATGASSRDNTLIIAARDTDGPATKKPHVESHLGEKLDPVGSHSLHQMTDLVDPALAGHSDSKRNSGLKKGASQAPITAPVGGEDEMEIGKMSIEAVFRKFASREDGLTEEEVVKAREIYGENALPVVKDNECIKFLMFMWNPLSWVMEMAALVAIVVSNGPEPWLCIPSTSPWGYDPTCRTSDQPPDWEDFLGIIILLILNSVIGYVEESAAGDAVSKLMAQLSPKCNVKRAGVWSEIDARDLVPGDIITIKLGDIIPADIKLLDGEPLKIDQSGLTGESLPVTKKPGDECYSGTTVKKGEIHAIVFATGINTFFGKAANLVATTEGHGHLQEVLTKIGTFCMAYISTWIIILVIVTYGAWHWDYRRGINMILVVLIGGIPIAMPTVLSVTMALGVNDLARQDAIVTRITAVEELAGMDVLCSDKTGTLTKNKLEVDVPTTVGEGVTTRDVLLYAGLAARREGDPDAIDICITNACKRDFGENVFAGFKTMKFVPFDPVSKRTEGLVEQVADGVRILASKGAPQVMIQIAHNAEEIRAEQEAIIDDFASRGLRTIGVGRSKDEGVTWEFMGLIPLLDPPRDDTKLTIERAIGLGVRVKMITGDQVAIGRETARRLGMGLNFHNAKVVRSEFIEGIPIAQIIEEADGFGEVFPEDKYAVVATLRKIMKGPFGGPHLVGMTGDGVNDAPALKVADVGIAVADATDAARSAADMVLLTEGLSVIIAAIEGSRRIFQRMKNYAIYACATTIRIVTSFGLLACIWQFSFPSFMVLVIAYLNDGTILTISKDYAVASPTPDAWRLREIFAMAFVVGFYLTASTVVYYYIIAQTTFFENKFNVVPLKYDPQNPIPTYGANGQIENAAPYQLASVIYLQVSITGQMVIFSTRARNFFFMSMPSPFLMAAFVVAQLVATLIAVYANWPFTQIYGCGWRWAGITWIWSFIWYLPLDCFKILGRLCLAGDIWRTMTQGKTMYNMNLNVGNSHMSGSNARRAPNSRAYALASAGKKN